MNYVFSNQHISLFLKHLEHNAISDFITRIIKMDIPIIENNLFLFVVANFNFFYKKMTIQRMNELSFSKSF